MKKLTTEQRDFIQSKLWLGKLWRKADWIEVKTILYANTAEDGCATCHLHEPQCTACSLGISEDCYCETMGSWTCKDCGKEHNTAEDETFEYELTNSPNKIKYINVPTIIDGKMGITRYIREDLC